MERFPCLGQDPCVFRGEAQENNSKCLGSVRGVRTTTRQPVTGTPPEHSASKTMRTPKRGFLNIQINCCKSETASRQASLFTKHTPFSGLPHPEGVWLQDWKLTGPAPSLSGQSHWGLARLVWAPLSKKEVRRRKPWASGLGLLQLPPPPETGEPVSLHLTLRAHP